MVTARLRLALRPIALRTRHDSWVTHPPAACLARRYEQQLRSTGTYGADCNRAVPRQLASFSGVGLDDLAALRRLETEADERLQEQPVYVRGEIALMRIVRHRSTPGMESIRVMLSARQVFSSNDKANDLQDPGFWIVGGCTLHSLPGAEKLLAASWQTNEWVGLDTRGDIIVYERWGAIDPVMLQKELSTKAFLEWNAYRYEARAMVVDAISRREQKVVSFTQVIDADGTVIGHRKLVPYLKELAGGISTKVVPPMRSTYHIVRSSKVSARILVLAGRMGFLSARRQARTFLIAGPDPFVASPDFSARFRRSSLPAAVGGTLLIGTASGARAAMRRILVEMAHR